MLTMPPPKKRKSAKGRPKTEDPKRSLVSLKGGSDYARWLDGLVRHANLPPTIVLELALRTYAEKIGYTEPQPKR